MNKTYRDLGEALKNIHDWYNLATRSYNPDTFDKESFEEQRSTIIAMELNWQSCREAMRRSEEQFGKTSISTIVSLDDLISTLKTKLSFQTQ